MAISQSHESEPSQDLPLGPGRKLRDARIAKNLEVAEVATRLRLHVRTINSIEADDYANLPVPTFVRGYLRGYARLLDLPCGPVVAAYEQNNFGPPPLLPDISRREEIKSTDFPVRLVTYAIAGILVIFVVIWWQSHQSSSTPVEAPPVAFAPAPSLPDVMPAEMASGGEAGEGHIDTRADQTSLAAPGARETDPPTLSPVRDNRSTDAAAGNLSDTASTPEPTESEGIGTEAADTALSPVEAPLAAPATPPGTAGTGLRLMFSHDSWVEVYGVEGKVLFYNLSRSGSVLAFDESGPYRVVLGYAQGVKVEFNGEPFDHAPHTVAGVARFALDASRASPSIAESLFLPQPSQPQ